MDDISSLFTITSGDWSLTALNSFFATGSVLAKILFFYNSVISAAGSVALLYIVTHAIVDTAHTGKPMGNFNEVWLPIRLGLAVGLAVPLPTNDGLNVAQELVYQGGKMAIGAADNAWNLSIDSLTKNASPIIAPPSPQVDELAHGLLMMEVCQAASNQLATLAGTKPWIIRETITHPDTVTIAFDGDRSQGFPETACGAVASVSYSTADDDSPAGATVRSLLAAQVSATTDLDTVAKSIAASIVKSAMAQGSPVAMPSAGNYPSAITAYASRIQSVAAQQQITSSTTWSQASGSVMPDQSARLSAFATQAKAGGWATAGAYMMRISDINGMIIKAAGSTPRIIMPRLGEGYTKTSGPEVLRTLAVADQWWRANIARSTIDGASDDALMAGSDAPALLAQFGLRSSLFRTFVLSSTDATTNPLAALVGMGHMMISAFWTAFTGMTAAIAFTTAVQSATSGWLADVATLGTAAVANTGAAAALEAMKSMSWFAILIMLSFLSAGVFYAYILPALPFIYWFFALGAWLQRLALGMLAAPVWGLTHMNPTGQGPLADGAMAGYALIVDIILRPLIMVISLFVGYQLVILLSGFFYPYFQTMVSHSLAGHADMFTGAIIYMMLGAMVLSGMMTASFSIVTRMCDQIIMMAGLRLVSLGDAQQDASSATGGVPRVAERVESSATQGLQQSGRQHTHIPLEGQDM